MNNAVAQSASNPVASLKLIYDNFIDRSQSVFLRFFGALNRETAMPAIDHLLEAALYADELGRAEAFYHDVLGLTVIGREAGRHVFFKVGAGVLLLFRAEETLRGAKLPAHGARGPGHVALAIAAADLDPWRRRLEDSGIPVEQEVSWPRGGRSLYFRDPAANVIELVTPGCWGLPSGW